MGSRRRVTSTDGGGWPRWPAWSRRAGAASAAKARDRRHRHSVVRRRGGGARRDLRHRHLEGSGRQLRGMDRGHQLVGRAGRIGRCAFGPRRGLRRRLRSKCAGTNDRHPRAAQSGPVASGRATSGRRSVGGRHRHAARGLRGARFRGSPDSFLGPRPVPTVTRRVVWDHGVSLPEHSLWLDPLMVRSFAFISHAHTDHARRHKEALLTPQTLALIPESRRPRGWRMLGYREPMRRGQATVTLHSAGHMLGSAQLHFEHEGTSLLYTGDLKLRQAGGEPPTFIPKADVLIIETTYGRPHFRFGDPDSTIESIATWCRRALESRVTPVLLCHALGKTEEVMLALAPYGFE